MTQKLILRDDDLLEPSQEELAKQSQLRLPLSKPQNGIAEDSEVGAFPSFGIRAPTINQKHSMRIQSSSLALIKHFTGLLIQAEVERFKFCEQAIPAVSAMTGQDIATQMRFRYMADTLLHTSVIRPVTWESINADLVIDYKQALVEFEFNLASYELRFITRSGELCSLSLDTIPNAASLKQAIATHLYLLDVDNCMDDQGVQGRAIPRFMRGYPDRTVNEAVIKLYSGVLMIMRKMMADGIEVEDITRDGMKETLIRIKQGS